MNRESFNNENERGQKISTANASEKGSNTCLSNKEEDIIQMQNIVSQILEEAKRSSMNSIEGPTDKKSNSSQELE